MCVIRRKGKDSQEFTLTKKDLELSGGKYQADGGWLFPRGKGASITWKKYPKIHWLRRTRAFALKCVFPDMLKGISIFEYDDIKTNNSVKEGKKAINNIEKDYGSERETP